MPRFMPPNVTAKVWAYFDRAGEGRPWPIAHVQVGGYDPRDELLDPVWGLLGTDFPQIPYRYVTQLQALAELDLGDDWLRAVCYHNPVRLLGL